MSSQHLVRQMAMVARRTFLRCMDRVKSYSEWDNQPRQLGCIHPALLHKTATILQQSSGCSPDRLGGYPCAQTNALDANSVREHNDSVIVIFGGGQQWV